jgi:hypothetical protein
MQFSPVPWFLISLRPKYHPQLVWETKFYTHVNNRMQQCCIFQSVYFMLGDVVTVNSELQR